MPQLSDIEALPETNGNRLAELRRRRRWNQQRLATESGYSLSAVKKFEQGLRSLDRADVILRFSKALDCHPTEITGQPYMPPGTDHDGQAAVAATAAVHRALLRHGRPTRPADAEVARVELPSLRQRVAEVNGLRHKAALARTAELLPQLLRDLQVAAEVSTGNDRRAAFDLLTSGYECAMQYLYKLGRTWDATLATERVLWSAEETEDPLRVIAAKWYDAGEFLAIGEHDEAGAIIDGALTDLGAVRGHGPEKTSLEGAFHLKAALNHARATDQRAADRHLKLAEEVAGELGEDRNDYQLQFGPTNVAIWSVTLPVEMGRGRDAVRQAERVRVPEQYAPERRTQYLIDVGRAHFYNGQPDDAYRAFMEAERLAPQQTRMHAGVKETVRVMRRTARRTPHDEFALRLGVA
ncbi:XRE family transcriptional regulator [Wenjunlia vitaminophila]|uniref:XRE family transcriptional regulator n=1 Tax=Wenjunlia vitaminophila TaxID=76728 RepID=A0A0T6LS07_WENVI|nr:helix-turn-helix transcriptional regulator [Wenjunlia vitaminophila]KRV48772.1 XRE family transcriptional regulator [Wenjunlia vitaminophila]